jgi:hypothetical protein
MKALMTPMVTLLSPSTRHGQTRSGVGLAVEGWSDGSGEASGIGAP